MKGFAKLLPMFVCAVASGCGEQRGYVNHELKLLTESATAGVQSQYLGGGCTEVADGVHVGMGGGSSTFTFSMTVEGTDQGGTVILSSAVEHIEFPFDEAWLRGAGPPEEVTLTLDSSRKLEVRLTGSTSCVRPDEAEE